MWIGNALYLQSWFVETLALGQSAHTMGTNINSVCRATQKRPSPKAESSLPWLPSIDSIKEFIDLWTCHSAA